MEGAADRHVADKALIVAPFWRDRGHIGAYRVASFLRWLNAVGVGCDVVCSAPADAVVQHDWGRELCVRDPLRLSWQSQTDAGERDRAPTGAVGHGRPAGGGTRVPRFVRQWGSRALSALLAPDNEVLWARRVARHPLVLDTTASFVISSNPPESSHIAAARLADRLGARLVVDMRDGWLDLPLRTQLAASRLRQMREARLEASILRRAQVIFVTSPQWRALLLGRLPELAGKVTLLTNGYLDRDAAAAAQPRGPSGSPRPLTLVHAGRFTGSRPGRRARLLLAPLLDGLRDGGCGGTVQLLGDLAQADLDDVAALRAGYAACGWNLAAEPGVPRAQLMQRLRASGGLLLLALSEATLPLKLFEYIPARRPLLAVAPRDGAVWQVCASLPQAFLLDVHASSVDVRVVRDFLAACQADEPECLVPEAFTDAARRDVFLGALGLAG